MKPDLYKIILIISILLFAVSLTQPAFYTSARQPDGWANSVGLLLIGWTGTLVGGAGLAWIANPLIFFAWTRFKKRKTAVVLSGIATIAAASFLMFDSIITGEDGNYSKITERKVGYWLWLISIAVFFIGTTVSYFINDYQKGYRANQNTNNNIQ